MAKLNFSVRGHVFQRGIDSIEQAYQTTVNALAQQIKDAQTQASYRPYAGEDIGLPTHVMDREEYEHPGVSQAEIWAFIEENAWSSLVVAREAYMVILYHHWEKQCAEWMGEKYDQGRAFEWLQRHGTKPDTAGINRLRLIANYVKHQSTALKKDHPDLIRDDRVALSHERVDEIFQIVRKSGFQTLGERPALE